MKGSKSNKFEQISFRALLRLPDIWYFGNWQTPAIRVTQQETERKNGEEEGSRESETNESTV